MKIGSRHIYPRTFEFGDEHHITIKSELVRLRPRYSILLIRPNMTWVWGFGATVKDAMKDLRQRLVEVTQRKMNGGFSPRFHKLASLVNMTDTMLKNPSEVERFLKRIKP